MNENILAIDVGFGDIKSVYGDSLGNITHKFKIPTIVGIVDKSDIVQDDRIYTYKDKCYYVGEDALALESNRIIDITDYNKLEYFAPLIVHHICNMICKRPDTITPNRVVTGLSKAQIGNAEYFKNAISCYVVNGVEYKFDIVNVLPQGVPSKLTLEKFGIDYPNINTDFMDTSTYVAIDIGFNTLDTFVVINGKASASLAEGVEGYGIMKIANKVKSLIAEDKRFNRTITLKEAKDILDTNTYQLRGVKYNLSSELDKLKSDYLESLRDIIEKRYGSVIDKMDNIYLIGGGSIIFRNIKDPFFKVPKADNEYYNAIGFYLRYCNK